MILEDDDLRIRPVVLPDDVRLALPWYADPEVMDLSESSSEPYGEQTAAQILGWARASPP